MATVDLLKRRKRVTISSDTQTLTLDASLEETHQGEAEITDYPVEEGSNISDNTRPLPAELTLHAFVSTYPLETPFVQSPVASSKRGRLAWNALRDFQVFGDPLTVRTTLFTYHDMLIKSLSAPRTAENSQGLEFTVTFKQIFTASSKIVPIPKRKSHVAKVDTGSQGTGDATGPQADQAGSILADVFGHP